MMITANVNAPNAEQFRKVIKRDLVETVFTSQRDVGGGSSLNCVVVDCRHLLML